MLDFDVFTLSFPPTPNNLDNILTVVFDFVFPKQGNMSVGRKQSHNLLQSSHSLQKERHFQQERTVLLNLALYMALYMAKLAGFYCQLIPLNLDLGDSGTRA